MDGGRINVKGKDLTTVKDLTRMMTPMIPSDDEIKEHLALDAQILGLAQPVAAASVFDFTLQREINKELGIK